LPHDFNFTVGEDPDPEYEDSAELEAEEIESATVQVESYFSF